MNLTREDMKTLAIAVKVDGYKFTPGGIYRVSNVNSEHYRVIDDRGNVTNPYKHRFIPLLDIIKE